MYWTVKTITCSHNWIKIKLWRDFGYEQEECFYIKHVKDECIVYNSDKCYRCNKIKPNDEHIVCYDCYNIIKSPIRICECCHKEFYFTIPRFFSKFKAKHVIQRQCGKCEYWEKVKKDINEYSKLWKYKIINANTSSPHINLYYNNKYVKTLYYYCPESWHIYGYMCA
jgi:hypothetical protein